MVMTSLKVHKIKTWTKTLTKNFNLHSASLYHSASASVASRIFDVDIGIVWICYLNIVMKL